jgi:hypothetical protein
LRRGYYARCSSCLLKPLLNTQKTITHLALVTRLSRVAGVCAPSQQQEGFEIGLGMCEASGSSFIYLNKTRLVNVASERAGLCGREERKQQHSLRRASVLRGVCNWPPPPLAAPDTMRRASPKKNTHSMQISLYTWQSVYVFSWNRDRHAPQKGDSTIQPPPPNKKQRPERRVIVCCNYVAVRCASVVGVLGYPSSKGQRGAPPLCASPMRGPDEAGASPMTCPTVLLVATNP